MGSSTSRDDESNNKDTMEVYLLYKKLNAEEYIRHNISSHHTVLLKDSDGSFYYTDLDVDSKGGPCQLHFNEYTFLNMPIFYKPIGRTRKSVNEIIEWVKRNEMAGTPYNAALNNCQKYAHSCIQFLNIFDIPRSNNIGQHFVRSEGMGSSVQEYLAIQSADSPNTLNLS
jgi:hypothetical protein